MHRLNVFYIYLGAFFISFSYGLFLTIPLFIQHFGGNSTITGFVIATSGVGTITAIFVSKYLFKSIEAKLIAGFGGLFYSLGAFLLTLMHGINFFILIPMLLLGFGWGLYYNGAPYTISQFARNTNRSTLFSYLSAFSVLGTGVAPVLISLIWKTNINFFILFSIASLGCLFSSICFFFVKSSTSTEVKNTPSNKETSLKIIFRDYSLYPIGMVFFGACAFTIMLNFQTTFANSIGMNYAFFYMLYSTAVVISRLFLGKWLSNFNQYIVSVMLLSLMTISLISFLLSSKSIVFYSISSALFGISYGLIYPTIQAIAVNLTDERFHSDVISYFSLAYFFGVYSFPMIGGLLIAHLGYSVLIITISILSFAELVLAIFLCTKMMTYQMRFIAND